MSSKTLFIDWSGDLGFRFGRGSSNYVAIALVHVADYAAFCQSAANLRAQRRLVAHYEYHYAHIPKSERAAYFTMLRNTDLAAWVLIADKRKDKLEDEFKKYLGVKYAVSFNSGRSALYARSPTCIVRNPGRTTQASPPRRA